LFLQTDADGLAPADASGPIQPSSLAGRPPAGGHGESSVARHPESSAGGQPSGFDDESALDRRSPADHTGAETDDWRAIDDRSFVPDGPHEWQAGPDDRCIEDRYTDVELARATTREALEPAPDGVSGVVPDDALDDLPIAIASAPSTVPMAQLDGPDSPPSHGATWTVAALCVGLVCGFGGGYLARGREARADRARSTATPTMTAPPQSVVPSPPARAFTESTIDDAPAGPGPDPIVPARPESGRAPIQPDQSTAPGRLLVRSTPADATVFVDGSEQGRTPATIRGLAPGAHRLRFVRDGFVAENRRIVITIAQPAQSVSVDLQPSRTATVSAARTPEAAGLAVEVGTLDVESRPPGAQVFLDGTLVGTTPFEATRIGAGRHAIGLERNGYRRWLSSVWIAPGERNRITASLER
jgi:hypothetical protein